MPSQPQIDANRRNALKSTGPKTPAGKDAVRLNSLWHGAFAADMFLPGENSSDFDSLRDGFLRLYHPADPEEEFLVNRMVLASWRLQRLAAMESRVLRAHATFRDTTGDFIRLAKAVILGVKDPPDPEPVDPQPADPIAHAWIRDANNGNLLAKLARYQTTLEHSFYHALKRLQSLREDRIHHRGTEDTEKPL